MSKETLCKNISLSTNSTKWSNTIKQFVGNSRDIMQSNIWFFPMRFFLTAWLVFDGYEGYKPQTYLIWIIENVQKRYYNKL